MNPLNPQGNQNAAFGQFVSQQGINVNNATPNQLIYSNTFDQTIYYNATGQPAVLLGLRNANANNGLEESEQGLFVSPDGVDVTQATDNQLIFSSQRQTFQIELPGTAVIPGISTPQPITEQGILTTSAEHGLGYIPSFLAFTIAYSVTSAGNPSPLPNNVNIQISGISSLIWDINNVNYSLSVGVDAENIYFGNYWNTFSCTTSEPIQEVIITYQLFTVSI